MTQKSRGQAKATILWAFILPMILVLGCAVVSCPDAPTRLCGRRTRAAVRECPASECEVCNGIAGTWYWLRSPDEEKRAVAALYNRYCIRCHGVDGRGVWDIPDVPNFTNRRWQACHSDDQLARIIVEGRGAVMPPFRGTLSLEEACAVGRYLRTFVPGTEVSRPAQDSEEEPKAPSPPKPKKSSEASSAETPGIPKS